MNLVGLVLYFVLPVAFGVYFFLKKKFSYFDDLGIPTKKPNSLLLGHMDGVGRTKHFFHILKDTYLEMKGKDCVTGFYSSFSPVFLVTDIEMVKIVTIKEFNNFINRGTYLNEENEPMTGHLFNLQDERWRYLRNKLSPVFTSGKLKGMFDVVDKKGKNFIATIERNSKNGQTVEMKDISSRFTVDILTESAFGMESDTLNYKNPELMNFLKELFSGFTGIWAVYFFLLFAFPKVGKFFNLRLFGKELTEFFTNVVSQNIKYREDSNDNRKDFLNMLIQLKNKGSIDGEFSSESKKLTLDETLAQAFLFLVAGSDTTSTVISFALMELARNPDIQKKLREEIEEKTASAQGELTYENLHEMNYLNQVINETLRMYPAAISMLRQAKEEFKIPNSNHVIPKGANVWIPTVGFHYDERYWKNPNKFDPEHFSQEQINDRPSGVYTPFGEGPRNCIGMRFGLMNLKYAVAAVIKNFELSPDPKISYPFKMNPKLAFLEPEGGGYLLKLKKL